MDLQHRILNYLTEKRGHALTSVQLASGIGAYEDFEAIFKLCEHLAANAQDHDIQYPPAKLHSKPPIKRLRH